MKMTDEDRESIKRDLDDILDKLTKPENDTIYDPDWTTPTIMPGYIRGQGVSTLNYYSDLATSLQILLDVSKVSDHFQEKLQAARAPPYVTKYFAPQTIDISVHVPVDPISSVYSTLPTIPKGFNGSDQ